jgi:galactose mutarotase-like enzyme
VLIASDRRLSSGFVAETGDPNRPEQRVGRAPDRAKRVYKSSSEAEEAMRGRDSIPARASYAAIRFAAVAVEPQTHAPNGLRRLLRGEAAGLAWLAPGATLPLEVELDFSRDA